METAIMRYLPFGRLFSPNLVISRSAVSLSYKVLGLPTDGLPIMILHGLLGCKKNWNGIGKTIVNMMKRNVIIVDLRNHGFSPHTKSNKYEELTEDVLLLLDKLKIKKACLLGHSMGGRAAMCVSLTEPSKVASLLVVDISPVSTCKDMKEFYPTVMNTMKSIDFSGIKKISKAKKLAKKHLKEIISDRAYIRALVKNINRKSDGTVGWTYNLDILMKHFKYIASFPKSMEDKKYLGPTLFIGGQFSEFIPADDLPGIREIFPRAVVKFIPKTGHFLHWDDPKSFLELSIAFFKNN